MASDPRVIATKEEIGASWLAKRKWALVVAAVFIGTGIAFTFWWGPVIEHIAQWAYSGDLWDTYRAAQWTAWGNEGTIYEHGIYSIVFPGIDVLLAPVAMVAVHFRLVNPYPYFVAKPSVLPILMPYVLAISALSLLAFDVLAEFLEVGRGRRIFLCWMQGALLWPLVVLWGHPEEALCLAAAILALMAALRGRVSRAAWLMGFAIAFQPYALLLVPLLLGLSPRGTRLVTVVRSMALSGVLLVLPVLQAWHATTHAILVQPTYLHFNHATPLLALAPHLAAGVYSAGPGRYGVALCALGAGWWTLKHQPGPREVFWLAAMVLALRCVLEPVVAPYYIWACAVLLITVSAGQRTRHFVITTGSLAFASVWAYHFTSEWGYWLPIVIALAIAVKSSQPGVSSNQSVTSDVRSAEASDTESMSDQLVSTGLGLDR
jgi:hypothetical protein